jgi:AraC-like DNA-binding protein
MRKGGAGGVVEERSANGATVRLRAEPGDHLWLSAFWGAPTANDVRAIAGAWSRVIAERTPYRSLVDASRMSRVDPRAFGTLVEHLVRARGDYAGLLERQAIVRPDGIVGAVVAGLQEVTGFGVTFELFTSLDEAMVWIAPRRPDELLVEARGYLERWIGVSPTAALLRRELARDLAGATVVTAARALGMSVRSLQRRLLDEGLSFRDLLDEARFERAAQLLTDTDDKIGAIARDAGFESESAFAAFFRRRSGLSPTEWRARQSSPLCDER